MKKSIFLLCLGLSNYLSAQEIITKTDTDWNSLKYSGFYTGDITITQNLPNRNHDFFWGLNIAFSRNKDVLSEPYYWGGQMAIGINRTNSLPAMYIRSTNKLGEGRWAKVLVYNENQFLDGDLNVTQNITASGALSAEGIRLGRIGDIGNRNVEKGAITKQLNLDFTGYRDIKIDQIGARISAIRYNTSNNALVQKTGLSFYTNPSGLNDKDTDLRERMHITPDGKVGIGTNTPSHNLEVSGSLKATTIHSARIITGEVEVKTDWADFVFNKDYKLPSLSEVESHIEEHKHLPGIPSEAEVKENGVGLGEMQVKLLQKIEELTLYVIEQNKRIEQLEKENKAIKKDLKN